MTTRPEANTEWPNGVRGPGLLASMRQHPFLVALVTLAAGAAGYGISQMLPTAYSATANVFLANRNEVAVFRTLPNSDPALQAQDAAELMRSDAVLLRAGQILHDQYKTATIKQRLSISPSTDSATVTIKASAPKAAVARDIANAEGQAYAAVASEQEAKQAKQSLAVLNVAESQIRSELDGVHNDMARLVSKATDQAAATDSDPTLRARDVQAALANDADYQTLLSRQQTLSQNIADVRDKITEVRVDSALLGGDVDQFIPATLPLSPTNNARRNTALAAVLGLLLGAAVAWRRSERSVGPDSRAIASTLGAPLLARLGHYKALSSKGRPAIADFSRETRPAEDFKAVVASLAPYLSRHELTNLIVASTRPGEGRTTVALNLAAAADQLGYDAVIVDEDLSLNELAHLIPPAAANPDNPALDVPYPGGGRLRFLPRGALGNGRGDVRTTDALDRLGRRAAVSGPLRIFDTSYGLADPALGKLASAGALLVVVSGGSPSEQLETLRARADLAGLPTVGFIVNEPLPTPRSRGQRRKKRLNNAAPNLGTVSRPPIDVNKNGSVTVTHGGHAGKDGD